MTICGYPPTNQEIQTMSDSEAEKAFAEHFAAPNPEYANALDELDSALLDLSDSAAALEQAAMSVYGTTIGNKLIVQAAEIRDNIRYLTRVKEEIEKCRKQTDTATGT